MFQPLESKEGGPPAQTHNHTPREMIRFLRATRTPWKTVDEIEHLSALLAVMRQAFPPAGGACMTTPEEMHGLHGTTALLLPGFKQAQAQLAVASHVLEYFARFPEIEISPGKYQPSELANEALPKGFRC